MGQDGMMRDGDFGLGKIGIVGWRKFRITNRSERVRCLDYH